MPILTRSRKANAYFRQALYDLVHVVSRAPQSSTAGARAYISTSFRIMKYQEKSPILPYKYNTFQLVTRDASSAAGLVSVSDHLMGAPRYPRRPGRERPSYTTSLIWASFL